MIYLHNREMVGNGTTATQNNIDISYTYVPGSFNAQGWLNWFEIFTRRNISLNGIDQLLFRDWLSVGKQMNSRKGKKQGYCKKAYGLWH